MDSKEYIDTDFNDVDDNSISGDPLFYTTSQVSEILGVDASTVRYYSKRFENLLDVEVSNKNKCYKRSDIAKLKFIRKLAKEDGLTLNQIDNYCSSKGFDIDKIESSALDRNNPLAIQAFTSAVMAEMDNKFVNFSQVMIDKMSEVYNDFLERQQEMNSKLQENIVTTVDEVVCDRLDKELTTLKNQLIDQETRAKERDTILIDSMHNRLNDTKKKSEAEEKKGFFKKLFFKKN